jgi:pyruvate formate lyase activating enzyme
MDNKLTGRIYDIQKFSVHDGPGIRTEVFLMGCPLKCLWCHSPESQSINKQLGWFEIRCIGVKNCGRCIEACPTGALKKGEVKYLPVQKSEVELIDIDRNNCTICGKCAEVCTSQALSIVGRDVTLEEVMAIIEKDRAFYRKSGGGVTISGGEALVQHEFTLALLKECKSRGLHTCLDTTGYAKWDICKEILPYVDLFLYDLKHMNSEKHRELTGVPNELILENARKMAAEKAAFQMRIPIIPGLTDSGENLRTASAFCLELGSSVQVIQILPYHRLGIAKYERLHKKYELEEITPPSDQHMESCKSIIESYGLNVKTH